MEESEVYEVAESDVPLWLLEEPLSADDVEDPHPLELPLSLGSLYPCLRRRFLTERYTVTGGAEESSADRKSVV